MPKSIIKHIKVARRANEEENLPNNYESLDINNFHPTQDKAVFFFGGNTTNRPEANNGNAKIMKSFLNSDNASKTNIYSFMYDSEPLKSQNYLSKEYEDEAKILYEKTFKPMLFDKKGYMKELKGIETAFKKIVFGAHCAGSSFVNIIINEFYNTLLEKYPPATAELLINKIQYFAYAPMEKPTHNVTSLIVTPYNDTSFSWAKVLEVAENEKVDIDFPKGATKRLLKAKQQGTLRQVFNSEFNQSRAIMIKVGNSTYLIPNQMNPILSIGDHSIECISKPKFLNTNTNNGINANITKAATQLYVNGFLDNNIIDLKKTFNMAVEGINKHPPLPENLPCK